MTKGPKGWDRSNDETEFFERPDSRGDFLDGGADETEVFGRHDYSRERFSSRSKPDRQETEFFDSPRQQSTEESPRQQFPPGYDPVSGTYAPGYGPDVQRGYGQHGYQEGHYQHDVASSYQGQRYEQPDRAIPESKQSRRQESRSGSGGLVALGFVAGLALVAAIVFFLLWRGSEEKPEPSPVTETATVTQTQTVEQTPEREPILPTELPELPSDIIPTALPELPSEVRDFDVEGFVNDILGNNGGSPDEPAPPVQ